MTMKEAKQDLRARLMCHKVEYTKIVGKTVSFEDLARCDRIFLTVHGVVKPAGADLLAIEEQYKPKPYIIHWILTKEIAA